MGTLINTSYYGITQFIVPVALMIFPARVRPSVIALGLAVGSVASIGFYVSGATFGGVNIGVPALAANLLVILIGRFVAPAPKALRSIALRGGTSSPDTRTTSKKVRSS